MLNPRTTDRRANVPTGSGLPAENHGASYFAWTVVIGAPSCSSAHSWATLALATRALVLVSWATVVLPVAGRVSVAIAVAASKTISPIHVGMHWLCLEGTASIPKRALWR